MHKTKLVSLGSEAKIICRFFLVDEAAVYGFAEASKFSNTAGKPSSVPWLAAAVTLFFSNPAFKCVSRIICISDRRLGPQIRTAGADEGLR